MRWIEIINVRSGETLNQLLIDELMKPFDQKKKIKGLTGKNIYRNALIETDLSVHIHWNINSLSPLGSVIGVHIAEILKGYGLVSHNIWAEEKRESRQETRKQ